MDLSRLKLLIGDEGFEALSESTTAVVGVGGVGSYAAEALARSGIGHLILIDGDTVSPTDTNRQIHADDTTLGLSKVEAMARRIRSYNAQSKLTLHHCFLKADTVGELLSGPIDYVVDAIDSIPDKETIILYCHKYGIPLVASMGAGNRMDPARITIADIHKTHTDPVARRIRLICRERGIKKLDVGWSDEKPIQAAGPVGSNAFVPAAMGLALSAHVVRNLLRTHTG
jgi:tRNA A37 threonylcarbamoyladenosine dehydratase